MNQNNKIDFTVLPEKSFLNETEHMDEHFSQFRLISDIQGELENYHGFIVSLVTFAYMKITAASTDNKFNVPKNASIETLTYNENQNFFADIFNRYKIICEANVLLDEIATILEPAFIAGANKLSVEFQKNFAKELLALDWSERGFTNQDCGLYVEGTLIREALATVAIDSNYPDLYIQVHHLIPLLNIRPDEKLICTSILLNTYLVNMFEQSGWSKENCNELVNKHMNTVMAVQADPALWAIHTIETVLFGCNNRLISKVDVLSTFNNKAKGGYDVIFLPEANNISVPDVGPITVANTVFEKIDEDGDCSASLYYVAFLYNLLNDHGRMLVRFDEKSETALKRGSNFENISDQGLCKFLVENNLIEAVIQTQKCTYLLIDKNRPESRHEKILFYYGQEFGFFAWGQYCTNNDHLDACIKKYSCESIQIRHDEGACIVSNKEIRLNGYCLLPKKYIYDFDRVKQQVESDMIHHIRHEANQLIPRIGRSLKTLGLFLNKHGLDNEPSQEKRDEDDIVSSVKELIDGSRTNLLQLQSVFSAAREVVLESFDKSNFNPCNLNKLFAEISNYQGHKKYSIQVKGTVKSSPIIYENAFRDMIENIIRNAEVHGFTGDRADYRIVFDLSQKGRRIVIKCLNNGEPLPPNFTKDKLFTKGDKGPNSTGMGLGGERIDKILAAHDAGFNVLPIGRLQQGFTVGFEITLAVERETNEQG